MLQNLDNALFAALNRGAANVFLDWLMPRLTNLHKMPWFVALAALGGLLIVWRGSRRERLGLLCALVAVGVSDLTAARIIKPLFPRDRPCHQVTKGRGPMDYPGVRLIGDCPGSGSFPSNHASNMMALACVGWWFTRRPNGPRGGWPLLWFLLPLLLGYSRIYLGYHYPSDVLGGWIFGGLIAAGLILAAQRLFSLDSGTSHRSNDELSIRKESV